MREDWRSSFSLRIGDGPLVESSILKPSLHSTRMLVPKVAMVGLELGELPYSQIMIPYLLGESPNQEFSALRVNFSYDL